MTARLPKGSGMATRRARTLPPRAPTADRQAGRSAPAAQLAPAGVSGSLSPAGASFGCGWREIGGQRCFFRSAWEANYARYLEWLRQHGQILEWRHEPETFWFEAIRRGVRSYKPDFRVVEMNGAVCYHEVKGYFDPKSRTKLKRMAKYHPSTVVLLIDAKTYRRIAAQVGRMIAGWETGGGRA